MVNLDSPKRVESDNPRASFQAITYDETDGNTKDIWIPTNGKRVLIDDIIISGANKNSGHIIVGVQIRARGAWHTIITAGTEGAGELKCNHAFSGKIFTAAGNGTASRIRAVKRGTSTSFDTSITIVGREV